MQKKKEKTTEAWEEEAEEEVKVLTTNGELCNEGADEEVLQNGKRKGSRRHTREWWSSNLIGVLPIIPLQHPHEDDSNMKSNYAPRQVREAWKPERADDK